MNLVLLPYSEVDGQRNFKNSQIMELFSRMQTDHTDEIVYCHGYIRTPEAFLEYVQRNDIRLYVVVVDSNIVGLVVLDRIEGKVAYGSFCYFSEFWGDGLVDVSRGIVDHFFDIKDSNGVPVLDLLIGYTATWNKPAINHLTACGWVNIGTFPKAVWNDKKQMSEPAICFYRERK